MSTLYKRLISQRIARSLIDKSNLTEDRQVQLEKRLRRLLKVLPVRKDSTSHSPHFSVDLPAISECLVGHALNLEKVQTEGDVEIQTVKDALHFKAESHQFAKQVLNDVWSNKNNYGYKDQRENDREQVLVEFSSPNIAKPFHVGHLRSTIIGNVISNLYEAGGHDVKRINFEGDWGTQFGLLSLGLTRYVDVEHLKADPLLQLFSIYVKINQDVKAECGKESEMTSQTYQEGMALFTKLENGDESMKAIWKMVKRLTDVTLHQMYQRLGVHFTHTLPESDYQDKTQQVLKCLSEANLLHYDANGVGYVQIEDEDIIGRASVVKSDGSSLYLTRDIASALDRQARFGDCSRVHYVVEQGQRGHFEKLVHILNKLDVPWASNPIEDIHIRFGRVKGMSTRQGNVVFLRDVLDEAKARVLKSMKEKSTTRVSDNAEAVADVLGVASIILQDLKGHRANDYTFSWDRMLNFKADSGVFVQYCHARLTSMQMNCGLEVTDDIDPDCLVKDESLYKIIVHLARYPDVYEDSLQYLEPHHLVQYLFRLCHLINAAYASCPVKGEATNLAQSRLLVFACARQVLSNCLHILGLQPLDEI